MVKRNSKEINALGLIDIYLWFQKHFLQKVRKSNSNKLKNHKKSIEYLWEMVIPTYFYNFKTCLFKIKTKVYEASHLKYTSNIKHEDT